MTSVEERVRAAAQAAAGQVREIRPLGLPDELLTPAPAPRRKIPSGRRWQGWLVPLGAVACVLAVAAGLAITHPMPSEARPSWFDAGHIASPRMRRLPARGRPASSSRAGQRAPVLRRSVHRREGPFPGVGRPSTDRRG